MAIGPVQLVVTPESILPPSVTDTPIE